ncbi:MAG: tandem-95 repeat protein, partial [Deltaproteobacteria bacterium]|nr:tandem-95 repeat protein [Deltaproteobacteria bacterium]
MAPSRLPRRSGTRAPLVSALCALSLSCALRAAAQGLAPDCGLEAGVLGDPTLRCQLYAPDPLVLALGGDGARVPPRLNLQARVAQAGVLLGDRVLPRVSVRIYDLKDQLVCAGERADVAVRHSVLDYTLDEADLGGCDLAALLATRRELRVVLCVGELSCLRPLKLGAVPYALKAELAYWARSAHQVERASVAHYAQRLTADRDLLLSTRARLPQNLTGSLVASHAQLSSVPHPVTGEVLSVPASHVGAAGLVGWAPARPATPATPATLHVTSKDPHRDTLRRLARLSVVAERLVVADELVVEGLPRAALGRDGLELLGGDLYLKNPLSVGGGLLVEGDALAPPSAVEHDGAVRPLLDARRYALSLGDVNAEALEEGAAGRVLRLGAGDLLLDGQLAVGRDLSVGGGADVYGPSSVAGRLSAGALTVLAGGLSLSVEAGAASGEPAARLSSLSVLPPPAPLGGARALRVSRGDLVVEGALAGGEGLSVTGASDLGALSTAGFATSALALRLREESAAGTAEVTLSALRVDGLTLSLGDPSAKLVVRGETRLEGDVVFEGPPPTLGGGCRFEVPPDQEGRPIDRVERLSLVCGEQVVTVRPFRCGNRRVDPGEQCDHGNLDDGDGCSSHCLCEPENLIDGVYFRPAPGDVGLVPCSGNLCGNEVLDVGEECDDGTPDVSAADLSDTCELCKRRACGNGVLGLDAAGAPEECDDGNLIAGDGCDSSCASENEPPQATPDAVTVVEDSGAVVIPVLANDLDVDLAGATPDLISLVSCAPATRGVATVDRGAGVVRYTPSRDFVGVDSFECTIQDRAGETSAAAVTVTVTNVNDPPVAVADVATTTEGSSVLIEVLSNDADPDRANPAPNADVLTLVSCTAPTSGSRVVNVATGVVTYTPSGDFVGVATLSCTIRDAAGAQSSAAVTVTVTNVNDAPVAVADSLTVAEDATTNNTVNVLTNDTDADLANAAPNTDVLTLVSCTAPTNGTRAFNTTTGLVTYTPNANYIGADTFNCTIRDAANVTSTAAVNVTVTSVNDAPLAVADSLTVAEDATTNNTVNVLTNDTDV